MILGISVKSLTRIEKYRHFLCFWRFKMVKIFDDE